MFIRPLSLVASGHAIAFRIFENPWRNIRNPVFEFEQMMHQPGHVSAVLLCKNNTLRMEYKLRYRKRYD